MKRKVLGIVAVIAVVMGMLVGCAPKADIRADVVESLTRLNKAGIERLDSELAQMEERLYEAEIEILKFQQVIVPAQEWIAYQEERAAQDYEVRNLRSWKTRVSGDGLEQFKNERYYITELSFSVSQVGMPQEESNSVIKVADSTSRASKDWKLVEGGLKDRKALFEQQRAAKLEKRIACATAFMNCIAHWEDWKIDKPGGDRYRVSGPGLGWANELTAGTWTYSADTEEIEPADSSSQALERILAGKF